MSTALFDASSGRRIDQLLAHYAESHRHPVNERIHFVCIPLIVFSLIGLLSVVHPWLAYAFVVASLLYYLSLSVPFLLTMAVASIAVLGVLEALGAMRLWVCIGVFGLAWVGQFIGHAIEGRKPSFFEDLRYLWIGPLFCLSFAFRRLGWQW